MANPAHLEVFCGTGHTLTFRLPVDVSAWTFSLLAKRARGQPDADAVFTLTTANGRIVVTGTFHADPALNTQRVVAALHAADTNTQRAATLPWELKRVDRGFESVLAFGDLDLLRGVHHA